MPDVEIIIGGRSFEVSCQEGEEHYLQSAAKMLDNEATILTAQTGRLPEVRMLLMSGLMLADKTEGMEDQLRDANSKIAGIEAELAQLRGAPAPEPTRIEVPVVPDSVTDTMAEIAARAEAMAAEIEEHAGL